MAFGGSILVLAYGEV